MYRDIYMVIGYSVCFLLVAVADVIMFIYLLLALVLVSVVICTDCDSCNAWQESQNH